MKKNSIKKLIAALLALAMVFSLCACGNEEKQKQPNENAGNEHQQSLTKQGYDYLQEVYADALSSYNVEYSEVVFLKENETPESYGLAEDNPLYENVSARILYIWVIGQQIPMYSVVFFYADGTLDYYTYMYEETAQVAAETRAAQDAYYDIMEEKLIEFYYNQYLQMNDLLIPQSDEDLEGWTQLDISHLL